MKWGGGSNGNRAGAMTATGRRRTVTRATPGAGPAGGLGGCAGPRALARRDAAPPAAGPEAVAYTLACPDVLEVAVGPRPDVGGQVSVGPDGAIPLGAA